MQTRESIQQLDSAISKEVPCDHLYSINTIDTPQTAIAAVDMSRTCQSNAISTLVDCQPQAAPYINPTLSMDAG